MKLYAIPTCPFVERVKIYLAYQKISDKVKIETIDLNAPPADLLRVNPTGSVPTLLFQNSEGLGESLPIIEYLDNAFASEKVFGPTFELRAMMKARLMLVDDKFLGALKKALYTHGLFNAKTEAQVALPHAFEFFETFLKTESELFSESKLNAIDIALAPFVLRFLTLCQFQKDLPLPKQGSLVERYLTRLSKHEAVRTACLSGTALDEAVKKFTLPHPALQKVLEAPRSLLNAPQLTELNATPLKNIQTSQPLWALQQGTKGPNLYSQWTFPSWQGAAQAFSRLQDICDTVDHHVNLNIKNMTTFEVSLCTHEPKWGISEKDFALAKALTALLFI